jgi:hypothetical protein
MQVITAQSRSPIVGIARGVRQNRTKLFSALKFTFGMQKLILLSLTQPRLICVAEIQLSNRKRSGYSAGELFSMKPALSIIHFGVGSLVEPQNPMQSNPRTVPTAFASPRRASIQSVKTSANHVQSGQSSLGFISMLKWQVACRCSP